MPNVLTTDTVLTLVVLNRHDAVIATGAIAKIGRVDQATTRAMVFGVCVAGEYRQRGLGKLLNAKLFSSGHDVFNWQTVEEILDNPDSHSRAIVEGFGLKPDMTSTYMFGLKGRSG